MSELSPYRLRVLLVGLLCGTLMACGSTPSVTKVAEVIKPYQIDRVQGNVVTREQIEVLKIGMPKRLVQEILGTPLLTSVFHADRWDYVFTLFRQGTPGQKRKVSVFFKGDVLERFESDDLPSEAEFVSTLKSLNKLENLPALQASPQSLEKFPAPAKPTATVPAPVSAPVRTNYPPLEPATP